MLSILDTDSYSYIFIRFVSLPTFTRESSYQMNQGAYGALRYFFHYLMMEAMLRKESMWKVHCGALVGSSFCPKIDLTSG